MSRRCWSHSFGRTKPLHSLRCICTRRRFRMPHTSPGCSWGQRKGERGTRRQSSCRLPLSTPATPGLGPGVLEPRDPRPAPSHGPSSASPVAQYQSAGAREYHPKTTVSCECNKAGLLAVSYPDIRAHQSWWQVTAQRNLSSLQPVQLFCHLNC